MTCLLISHFTSLRRNFDWSSDWLFFRSEMPFSIVAIHYVPSPQDSIDGERLVEKSHFKLRVLVERHLQTRSLILYNHYITTSTTCAFGCFWCLRITEDMPQSRWLGGSSLLCDFLWLARSNTIFLVQPWQRHVRSLKLEDPETKGKVWDADKLMCLGWIEDSKNNGKELRLDHESPKFWMGETFTGTKAGNMQRAVRLWRCGVFPCRKQESGEDAAMNHLM